jgi:tetratricopeptide (TPR) repeat protein
MSRCLLSLLVLLLYGCSNAESYLQKGKDLAAQKNYEEAILNYQKALQKDQNLSEAMYGIAMANQSLGNFIVAYQQLQQVARMVPNNEAYRVALGDLSLAAYLGDPKRPAFLYDQVTEQATRLAALPKGKADSLRYQAFLAATDRRTEDAIRLFRESLALAPNDQCSLGLARVLFTEKQVEESEKILLATIARRPDLHEAYDTLYSQYAIQKRTADGLALLEKWVASNPKSVNSVVALALHHARNNDMAAMKQALTRYQDAKNFPNGYANTGDFYALISNPDEALRWYADGIKSRPAERIENLKRQANLLAALGRRGEALQSIEEILKTNPKDENSLAFKARLALESNQDPTAALTQFAALAQQNPNNANYHLYYGRALIAKGDLEAARREIASAIRLKYDDVEAHRINVELQLQQRQFTDAHTAIDELTKIAPNEPKIPVWRSAAFRGQGNLGPAREQITQAFKANPNNPDVILESGLLSVAEKRFPEADALFRKLYVPGQGDIRPLEGLVASRLSQNQFDAALDLLKSELEKTNAPAIRATYALTAARARRHDLALEQFRILQTANPKAGDLHLRIGEVFQNKGNFDQAIQSFQEAKKLMPGSPEPDSFIAFANMAADRKADAIRLYREILTKQPNDIASANNLAFLLAESGQDLEEAFRLAQSVQQRLPNEPAVADTVGWVLFKRGMNDTALQVFSSLVKKSPDTPAFRYHYAHALIQKGDRTQAKAQLQNALTTAPNGPEAAKIQELLKKIS